MRPSKSTSTIPLLSSFSKQREAWRDLQSNSDQTQSIYMGLTPKQMAFGHPHDSVKPKIVNLMRGRGEEQMNQVVNQLLFQSPAAQFLAGKIPSRILVEVRA